MTIRLTSLFLLGYVFGFPDAPTYCVAAPRLWWRWFCAVNSYGWWR